MRLYTFEIYNKISDLDGYVYNIEPKIDMIISLTLCQKKLEDPNYIKEKIEKEDKLTIKNISQFEYKEEIFFKITKIIGKNKYEIEFYDFFTNNKVYIPDYKVYYKYYQTRNEYNQEVINKYETLMGQKDNSYLDDLLNNKISIEDVIDEYNLSYYDVEKLHNSKYINNIQFNLGIKKIMKKHKKYNLKYDPNKIMEEEYDFDGCLSKSKWLKSNDRITCYLNNIHYIPIYINKLKIEKPFYYRFPIIEDNDINDWNGNILDKNILNYLIPGNFVRTCFTLIDKKNNKEITGMILYFRIINIKEDIILGILSDPYYTRDLKLYNLDYLKDNFMTFNKRNISEIPVPWNENMKNYKLTKNYGYTITGYREKNEEIKYDIFR